MNRKFLSLIIITLIFTLFSFVYFTESFNHLTSSDTSKDVPIDGSNWSLVVDGLVQNPLNITISELYTMPRTTVRATLYCVGSPNTPVEDGNWAGVRLRFILEKAGISPEAKKIGFHADDGYSTDLMVQTATRDDIIIAFEKDDAPLVGKLRLVVPGTWGYKWIRGLNHIDIVNYDYKGTYETQGYSDTAEITG